MQKKQIHKTGQFCENYTFFGGGAFHLTDQLLNNKKEISLSFQNF